MLSEMNRDQDNFRLKLDDGSRCFTFASAMTIILIFSSCTSAHSRLVHISSLFVISCVILWSRNDDKDDAGETNAGSGFKSELCSLGICRSQRVKSRFKSTCKQ